MKPEFSRRLAVAAVAPRGPTVIEVDADLVEREAVAARLRLPAVLRLACRFSLEREGDRIRARGSLDARVIQTCVVSLEPFEADVGEEFEVLFVAEEPPEAEQDDDPLSPDVIVFGGAALDLGEAAVEQLALALDPFPRRPDAALPSVDPGAATAGPFAALGALKRG